MLQSTPKVTHTLAVTPLNDSDPKVRYASIESILEQLVYNNSSTTKPQLIKILAEGLKGADRETSDKIVLALGTSANKSLLIDQDYALIRKAGRASKSLNVQDTAERVLRENGKFSWGDYAVNFFRWRKWKEAFS